MSAVALHDDGWAIRALPPGRRDLGCHELWDRSLARSRRRRAQAERRTGLPVRAVSAALLTTLIVVPAADLASAQDTTAGVASTDLRLGSQGPAVAAAQAALGVAADGDFGPLTQAAVQRFQATRGLVADGVIGPLTRAALQGGGSTGTAQGAGSVTMALQRALGVAPFPLPTYRTLFPAPAIPPAGSLPLPPGRDVPQIGETESYPLPPARPPGFGAPTQSTTPERHASRPDVAVARPAAQPDNRNVIEKLFGWAHASAPVMPSTPRRAPLSLSRLSRSDGERASRRGRDWAEARCSASRRPLEIRPQRRFPAMTTIPPSMTSRPASSICRTEQSSKPIRVSAKALDNPRFVAERAVGPTPPHVYELTLRELHSTACRRYG